MSCAALLGVAFALARSGRLVWGSGALAAGFVALGASARSPPPPGGDVPTLAALYESLGSASFLTPCGVAGRLRREPVPGPFGSVLHLDAESIVVSGVQRRVRGGARIRVRGRGDRDVAGPIPDLVAGDLVFVWARLSPPAFFRNRGSTSEGVQAYFAREEIHLVGSVKSPLLVERVEAAGWWSSLPSRARRAARSRLEARLGHEPEILGVVLALVTGERSLMEEALEERYRRAGFYHVMAISGAHVGVVLVVLYGAGRLAGLETRTSLLAMLVVLPLYAAFCGGRAPVSRAASMAAVFAVARLLGLPGSRWNALAAALLLLLIGDPESAYDPGLQLTFAAMAAIFGLCDLSRASGVDDGLDTWRRFRAIAAISLAASAGVLPLAAWHFQRVSTLSPVTSLVAMPLASIALLLGLLLVVVSGLSGLAGAVAWATIPTVTVLNEIARFAGELPAASFVVPRPSAAWMLAYGLALVLFRSAAGRFFLAARASAAILLAGCIAALFVPRSPTLGRLQVTALDVGHGDALVLSLPDGRVALVDGGGIPGSSFDVGARVIVPYLLERGRRTIDVVILTHRDHDHVGGLTAVVEALDVGAIWENGSSARRAGYDELRRAARRRNVPFRRLEAGERFAFGGARWEVLASGGSSSGNEVLPGPTTNENDRSLVLGVAHGRSRLLLTGDAEEGLESLLVRERASLRADVLKVAHHGSASSTTAAFLDAVSPRIAIVSARQVPFRPIPSEGVLRRLHERGVRVFRTDADGAIELTLFEDGTITSTTYVEDASW